MSQEGVDWLSLVRDFYEKYQRPVRDEPTLGLPRSEVERLRDLLEEEVSELLKAMESDDIEKVADGIADVVYVVLGAALQYGVDANRAILAVHESNMTREAPSGRRTRSDKVPRGTNYVPPDMESVIAPVASDRDDGKPPKRRY